METIHGRAGLRTGHGPLFLVVGVFDGLHVGHVYLLEHLVREARARDAVPTVITFDAHPDAILRGHAPPLLLDPAERLERLAAAGAKLVIVEHFDDELRRTTYDAFVRGISSRTALAGVLMTPDAAFGHERAGTPGTLAALGATDGFEVVVVPPFVLDGREVRSAEIRNAIAAGGLAAAERLLGRPYAICGTLAGAELRPAMPVAMPPPGSYPVSVGGADAGAPSASSGPAATGTAAVLAIEAAGSMRLDPHPGTRRGSARVEFVARG